MKKYAVIDIGSNTVRMVIYTAEDAAFHGLFSKKYTLGLAGYIQDGIMTQEGIHKLCAALLECRTIKINSRISIICPDCVDSDVLS